MWLRRLYWSLISTKQNVVTPAISIPYLAQAKYGYASDIDPLFRPSQMWLRRRYWSLISSKQNVVTPAISIPYVAQAKCGYASDIDP